MRLLCALLLVVLLSTVSLAQEKPLSQAELASKPLYERVLNKADASKAAELVQHWDKCMDTEDWAEARMVAQALIDFRTQKQGADHWEVTDARLLHKRGGHRIQAHARAASRVEQNVPTSPGRLES
ncbi:MAG: hypothetical protein U0840_21700 [Gemmataceae bacterium]